MEDLINAIDLSDYRDKFENVHDDNFKEPLTYELINNKKVLRVVLKVDVDFNKIEEKHKNLSVQIKELNIWVNEDIPIEINYPTILKVKNKLIEQLKELY